MRIKCAHCGRPQRLIHARCRCCGSKLPLWYLRAAVFVAAALFLIANLINLLFIHAAGGVPVK